MDHDCIITCPSLLHELSGVCAENPCAVQHPSSCCRISTVRLSLLITSGTLLFVLVVMLSARIVSVYRRRHALKPLSHSDGEDDAQSPSSSKQDKTRRLTF